MNDNELLEMTKTPLGKLSEINRWSGNQLNLIVPLSLVSNFEKMKKDKMYFSELPNNQIKLMFKVLTMDTDYNWIEFELSSLRTTLNEILELPIDDPTLNEKLNSVFLAAHKLSMSGYPKKDLNTITDDLGHVRKIAQYTNDLLVQLLPIQINKYLELEKNKQNEKSNNINNIMSDFDKKWSEL